MEPVRVVRSSREYEALLEEQHVHIRELEAALEETKAAYGRVMDGLAVANRERDEALAERDNAQMGRDYDRDEAAIKIAELEAWRGRVIAAFQAFASAYKHAEASAARALIELLDAVASK